MAKDPAFLFYPNDWLGGTIGMTFEEKGAYMELLMMQFNRGHMTSHMIGQAIGQLWVKLEDKFTKDSKGLYYNERLEEEQIKRKSYTNSRKNNKEGKNQYSKQRKKVGHMTGHMEDEDVNENIIKDEDWKFKTSQEIIEPLYKKIWKLFPEQYQPKKRSLIWCDTLDKLVRIDEKEPHEIIKIIRWIFKDDFWSTKVQSVAYLRKPSNQDKDIKYYEVFKTQMKNGKTTQINTRTFSPITDDPFPDVKTH